MSSARRKPNDQGTSGGKEEKRGSFDIGYGKPPVHSRFQPGRSGNPRGRVKGVRNLRTDVRRTLEMPVKLNEQGKVRRVSTQEAALMRLREKGLTGDVRALHRFLELALRFNCGPEAEAGSETTISAEDQDILDAYAKEVRARSAIARQGSNSDE